MSHILELLAAIVCTLAGIHLWRAEPRARQAGSTSTRSGVDDGAESSAPATEVAEKQSSTAFERGESRRSANAVGSVAAHAGDAASAGASESALQRRRPRAPPSAIAPLPALAGASASSPRIAEPLARAALKYVGRDPAADEMWVEAINQADLPAAARTDLIEDLNDEGYPDPKHYTLADLPLILERLRIIERYAPHAMDEVNAAAFEEAYKDLHDMLDRLRGAAEK